MAQEVIPPGHPLPPAVENMDGEPRPAAPRRRFRISVGVALGLVFSSVLVVFSGALIAYMAAADRRITVRLLDERSAITVAGYLQQVDRFFREQTLLLTTVKVSLSEEAGPLTVSALENRFAHLLPAGAAFTLSEPGEAPGSPAVNEVAWTPFAFEPARRAAVLRGQIGLAGGQTLAAVYPRAVFQDLIDAAGPQEGHRAVLFQSAEQVVAVQGGNPSAFAPGADVPLPSPGHYTGDPLSAVWTDAPQVRQMGGQVPGRLFPYPGGMYTLVYDEIGDGPAKGWIVGALYRADAFGAALDQSRLVLYVAAAALIAGAVVSYFLGRMVGRPLNRLASASVSLKNLDFAAVSPLERSRLSELDEVNTAFNGSIGALHAFSRYVPRQLVQRLVAEDMAGKSQIETRQMTIVFTDLAGFTNLASHMSAKDTAAFLGQYFEIVSEAVTAQNGTIDKFLGDGVMAFWGAPSHQPDHAVQAMACVKALAQVIERLPDRHMRVRIGIHTGEVVVGNIGSSDRVNYTVIGDAVNIAARLQEYGKQIDATARTMILASGDTMARLPEPVPSEHVGAVTLRGRDDPIDVFRVS